MSAHWDGAHFRNAANGGSFVDDVAQFPPNLRVGLFLLGHHLGQAANDVERIAGLVGETGGGQIHFFEM